MLKVVLFLVVFTSTAFALDSKELAKEFVSKETIGPITVKQLERIDTALQAVRNPGLMAQILNALKKTHLSEITPYIRFCTLDQKVQGHYKRGESQGRNYTHQFGRIFRETWDQQTFDLIDNSYRYAITNHPTHMSLVVQSWPVICLKPGMSFFETLLTFKHESVHFLNDDHHNYHYLDYKNFEEYKTARINESGGELAAFKAEGQLIYDIEVNTNYFSLNGLKKFFQDGKVVNQDELIQFIFEDLNYNKTFFSNYQDLHESTKVIIENNIDTMESFAKTYLSNVNVALSNIDVHKYNIDLYERRIKFYNLSKDKKLLSKEKELLVTAKEMHQFYEKVLKATHEELIKLNKDFEIFIPDEEKEVQVIIEGESSEVDTIGTPEEESSPSGTAEIFWSDERN